MKLSRIDRVVHLLLRYQEVTESHLMLKIFLQVISTEEWSLPTLQDNQQWIPLTSKLR